MVYCYRCGTANSDDANVCNKCSAPLYGDNEDLGQYKRQSHYRDRKNHHQHYRRGKSSFGTLICGVIIIIIGLNVMFPEIRRSIPWWPIILISIGIWLLFIGIRRNRRYTKNPQQ